MFWFELLVETPISIREKRILSFPFQTAVSSTGCTVEWYLISLRKGKFGQRLLAVWQVPLEGIRATVFISSGTC